MDQFLVPVLWILTELPLTLVEILLFAIQEITEFAKFPFEVGSYFVCFLFVNALSGVVTTLVGSDTPGNLDGDAKQAQFSSPVGLAIDQTGLIFVSDTAHFVIKRIFRPSVQITEEIVSPTPLTIFAGKLVPGYIDECISEALFRYPEGIAIDGDNNIIVTDSWNCRVRIITSAGSNSSLSLLLVIIKELYPQ